MTDEPKNEQADEPQAESGGKVWSREHILDVLRVVIDPEIHMDIVTLGLVYDVEHRGNSIAVEMTLTTPGCPYGPYLLHLVRDTLLGMEGIEDVDLNLVWEPAWSPEKMSEDARLEFGFEV